MRCDLVFVAIYHIPNRHQLCRLASKATRRMHQPDTRVTQLRALKKSIGGGHK